MVGPERILLIGTSRRDGRREGFRVDRGQREVAVYEADLSRVCIQQVAIGLIMEAPAEWTLVIAEFHDGNGSILGSEAGKTFGGDVVSNVLRLRGDRCLDDTI